MLGTEFSLKERATIFLNLIDSINKVQKNRRKNFFFIFFDLNLHDTFILNGIIEMKVVLTD